MLIGVSKVAQSGFLSGLNNLTVSTMKDTEYQPFFGFTEPEVIALLSDAPINMPLVKKYYNGYIVPSKIKDGIRVPMSLFNPWSITNFKDEQIFRSFWMSTSSTLTLKAFLQKTINVSQFNELVLGNSIKAPDLER